MVWTRKLGVFELLVGMTVLELFLGDRLRALVAGVCAIVAWYAKRKFEGEFSLQQAWGVVTGAARKVADDVEKL